MRPQTAQPDSPLREEHFRQLAEGVRRSAKVRRAVAVARVSGWTTAVFAFVSLLSGLFSLVGLALGVALAVVAWRELRGARALARLDEQAPRRLALNQVFFGACLCAYAVWGAWRTLTGEGPGGMTATGDAQVDAMLADVAEPMQAMLRVVMLATYGGLLVGSVLAQGSMAWYYATRSRHVREHAANTPAWVVRVQRMAA